MVSLNMASYTRLFMETLIKEVANLRQKCHSYRDNIDSILTRPLTSDPISGCFAAMFNFATLTLEVLSYYYGQWKGIHIVTTKEDLKRSREENAERCKEITKMQFVLAISSIEYSAKETIKLYPKHPLAKWFHKQKRIYLSGVMDESKRIGLIDSKEREFWDCILAARNSVVHNNAIADRDRTYQIDGITVSFVKGKMLSGKLDFFVKLTNKAVDLYYSWIIQLIK